MSRSNPVLIVGASARPLAHSAQRAGYQVYAADDFADWDTEQVARIIRRGSPREMLSAIAGSPPADLPPVYSAYVGGFENHVSQVAELEQVTMLLGNSAAVLRELQDPIVLFDWIERRGFRVPQISLSEPPNVAPPPSAASLLPTPAGTWLKKKFRSCGGLGITFHASAGSAPRPAATSAAVQDESFYFQEFLQGHSLSAIYVAWHSGSQTHCRLLGVSHQLSGDQRFHAQGFQYTGSIIQPHPSRRLLDYARSLGETLVEQHALRGLFNIDFIEARDDFYFLEINPRYSASMELWERGTGLNLFELHHAACREQADQTLARIEQLQQATGQWSAAGPWIGKAIWYADRPLQGNEVFIRRALDYNRQSASEHRLAGVADLPRPAVAIRPGGPAFTVFDSGESQEEVTEKLRKTAKMLASCLQQ